MAHEMINSNIKFRVWDTVKECYTTDVESVELESNTNDLSIISNHTIEPYICSIDGVDYYKGDIVVLLDVYDSKEDYATLDIELSTNTPMCSFENDDKPLRDVIQLYTLARISSTNEIRGSGYYVCNNVCPECLKTNISLQLIGTSSFICEGCGSEY